MTRRASMSPEARSREREANRLRMALKRADPVYRAEVNARRKARDRERKAVDPTLRKRLTETSKRHAKRKWASDPDFRAKRTAYLKRWKAERLLDEAFEDFIKRIETGDDHQI
jgi:hypothetical protein